MNARPETARAEVVVLKKPEPIAGSDVLLVKLRPSDRLGAADSRLDLEPLHDGPPAGSSALGLDSRPSWFLARLEGAENPWDMAHDQIAAQLGIDESDVLFAEPDLVHQLYVDGPEGPSGETELFAAKDRCEATPQDASKGKVAKPGEFAWHLDDNFTQLRSARNLVPFDEPRTRIAHLDTGYDPGHSARPAHVLEHLEWNFVGKDGNPTSAADPDNWLPVLDNSGHGTGTLGILAGGPIAEFGGEVLGGAPNAAIVPIRVCDSVVLLRTSALARALRYAADLGCAVATLSMGGVPTRAWGEAVDEAYEAGLCLCAAAGNRVGFAPPRRLVYPARYDRVIAVAGVMANHHPYRKLKGTAMEGSFGPESAMEYALAAYTPNIPWARYGCPDVLRLNGEGTSSATPQVAAAAALWIEKYKNILPNDWRRVEAVRHALFSKARKRSPTKYFGQGILQAKEALAVMPDLTLPKSARSDSSFGFLRVLTGLGVDEATPREEMFNIELAQRWLLDHDLQDTVPDPDRGPVSKEQLKAFMERVIEDKGASLALRRHVAARYPLAAGQAVPVSKSLKELEPKLPPVGVEKPEIPTPPYRRIRVYTTDPSLSTRLETVDTNEVTLKVRWEKLKAGPEGEYLTVDDTGPHSYPGVNLNNQLLLAQDGWEPSEGNPQFHQQMVYAVAMKTIEHFEHALGRPILWRPRPNPNDPHDDSQYVQHLTVRPHALQKANAYYSPQEVALLFGYFKAPGDPGFRLPGSPVYTCLSHDIIAHETTHAILDGMHRRFNEPTNVDVLALHEAFADIVALLQHFTIPELLEREIARTRGDLEADSVLGKLAVEFGRAASGRGALRDAIGKIEDGVWKRLQPNPEDLAKRVTPHSRGAILVAAVFDALIAIYKRRIADLLRIYTGGTGVLPSGAIHPDLVGRLAAEASKAANHVLSMCIRALDYLPPVDVTFFDYLRALITADFEMVSDDKHNYRVAFVEAFSRRAIFPGDHDEGAADGARALSADTLRWPGFTEYKIDSKARTTVMEHYHSIVEQLKSYADACLYLTDREKLFQETRLQRIKLHGRLKRAFAADPAFADSLGLDPTQPKFEVHTLRRAMRFRLDGKPAPQVFVSLIQRQHVTGNPTAGTPDHTFHGGSTLVVDLADAQLPKYRILKRTNSRARRAATASFLTEVDRDPLRKLFFSDDRKEPFAALHELAEEGT
jgi:hypothetical protein